MFACHWPIDAGNQEAIREISGCQQKRQPRGSVNSLTDVDRCGVPGWRQTPRSTSISMVSLKSVHSIQNSCNVLAQIHVPKYNELR